MDIVLGDLQYFTKPKNGKIIHYGLIDFVDFYFAHISQDSLDDVIDNINAKIKSANIDVYVSRLRVTDMSKQNKRAILNEYVQ